MHSMCNKLTETVRFSEMTRVITTWCQNPKGYHHFHNFYINLKMDHFRNGYKCFKRGQKMKMEGS